MMTMVCHLMTFEGERPLPNLPPTTVPATASLPVYELQEALHRASNLDVPPPPPPHISYPPQAAVSVFHTFIVRPW